MATEAAVAQTETQTASGSQTTETTKPATSSEGQKSAQTSASTDQGAAAPAKTSGDGDAKSKGLIADLQKERKARQEFEKKFTALEASLKERERQIQALTGAKTPTADEAEVEAIRSRLAEIAPATKLTDEQIQRILALADSADSLGETTQHYWQRHGSTMLDSLAKEVATELGGDGADLTDRQRKALYSAFVQEAEGNPEFLARYEKGDPALIKEFAKGWVDDWFEPARRKVSQQAVNRGQRPVPRSGPGAPVVTKPATKAKDLDEVTDRAVSYMKDHGLMS